MSKTRKSAMEAAASYLASRMRTAQEVRTRLHELGYSNTETEEALKELESLGYINDAEYALRYFEYNREKKRGSKRAFLELMKKGVDEQTARNARDDFLHENKVNEFEDALHAALREAEGKEYDDKLGAKIARKLETRGFENSDIIRVLGALRKNDYE